MSRSAERREQLALAAHLRERGFSPAQVGAALRDRYGVNGRRAQRVARGWTQAEAAEAWNARWPDEPKTFKNFSYWELWPASTGHAPSLAVLDKLAQLYECDAADLLAGWGEHGRPRTAIEGRAGQEPETLAWQTQHLDLHELTRSLTDWADRLPGRDRHALLLKMSTAMSLAASTMAPGDRPQTARRPAAGASHLAGTWTSTYSYTSTSRGRELDGTHTVDLRVEEGRLRGRSRPLPSGSSLELDLTVDGSLATGTWTERTSPTGHYRAATYHGLVQLVVDPTGHTMTGMWLGIGRRYVIKSGQWRLERMPEPPDR